MAIKLVVFDMAGTTVEDKGSNVHAALISTFGQFGFAVMHEDANKVMGMPKPIAIQQILENELGVVGKRQQELIGKIHKAFVEEMITFYQNDPSVKSKENAEETFRQLKAKGIMVGIDTGFSRDIADVIFKRLGWSNSTLIDLSVTSDEVKNGRPHPDLIFAAMKLAGITSAEEVAKVGDTQSDLQEGSSAGCKYVIGITTGAFSAQELAREKHTHLIADLLEVVAIVS